MSDIAVLDLADGTIIHATPEQFAAAFAAAEASKHAERAADALCASVRATYDENAPIAEGDYLYASWGYDQTNIDWFQVTRRKGDWLTLQPCAAIETADGDMTGTSIPGAPDPKEKPIRRRVIRWQGQAREAGCKWKSYGWMSKWDGIPKRTSSYG